MKNVKFEYKNWKGRRKFFHTEFKAIEFGKTPHIDLDQWLLVAYDHEDGCEKKFVMENIQRICKKDEKQIIPCITTYVVNDKKEFFLMFHKKLNQWVPSGGKIEKNETPDEAAIRETFEETGLNIVLIEPKERTPSNLKMAFGVQLNIIIPNFVKHLDWIYLAKTVEHSEFVLDQNEGEDAKWFTIEEIRTLDTFKSVKDWCEYFSKQL